VASLPACLLADFSYDQSTKMTGGAMMQMMRIAGAFSKQAREPIQSSVAVKGNRMVHGSKDHASIIDLDAETITTVDFQKKTYSVMTFAEMQQAMEHAMQQMQSKKGEASKENPDVKTDFKMSVKATGATKQIAGYDTKEMLMTMTIEGTDQKTGNKANILVNASTWLTPKVAGYEEVREFYKKMSTKIAWTPGGANMMAGNADMGRGMAAVAKEAAKLDGIPVLQVMKTSMEGQPGAGATGQTTSSQPQSKPKPETPSISGALAGKLGGFGGFGRKKKQEEPKKEEATAAGEPAAATADDGTLMEMTTEMSNFSTASVDASKLTVPSGFKKVENEMVRRNR
jgi:sRNA-binding protein